VNRLAEIITKRQERVAAAKIAAPRDFEKQVRSLRAGRPEHALFRALNDDGVKVIAEFKRRSPSKGTIKADANPATTAGQYECGGAAAISVLTEPDYFDGSLDDLRSVRRATALPILRKDFIIDVFQVYEAAAAGADALLLIVAALTDIELSNLRQITEDDLGMDALVEVHTSDEMQRAIDTGATVIGVNNRNLATFEVSLETSIELARLAPGKTLISESGIETIDDINRLRIAGYQGFLIGEALMRAADPAAMLAELTQQTETAHCPGK
jgi:indole-3-glycerol phosphate synthase